MKADAMRVAIAGACGWKRLTQEFYTHLFSKPGTTAENYPHEGLQNVGYPPDYPNDLNACAEMERTLTKDECSKFHDQLIENKTPHREAIANNHHAARWTWHASAPQRCEAFLRVKGLYQPSPSQD